ncbi:hypothetical protein RZN22_16070 [Bacillaceae bacterium S4-13-58]
MRNREKFYEELPDELLSSFYYYIQKNIENGVRIPVMVDELVSLVEVATKKNISLSDLRKMGKLFVENEINLVNQEYPRLVKTEKK